MSGRVERKKERVKERENVRERERERYTDRETETGRQRQRVSKILSPPPLERVELKSFMQPCRQKWTFFCRTGVLLH